MSFLRRLGSKSSSKAATSNFSSKSMSSQPASMPAPAPARTSPTRRPAAPKPAEAPPAYTPRADTSTNSAATMAAAPDSPYSFLTQFDTVFLIDDSGSMAGRSWRETSEALRAITSICTAHDQDGIDIYFLNHRNPNSLTRANSDLGGYENVTADAAVQEIFSAVRPWGGTPTGTRLNQILKPYLQSLELGTQKKPLNIIVVTDGVPSDDVESVIVSTAKRLDKLEAEPWQVGIQFFQVGRESEAAEDLRDLDDALGGQHGVRDIVDTVPWSGDDGAVLTADGILKVVLGAVNKRLDRRRGSDERLRR